jgi:molybdate transport system regulatory protein
MNTLKGKIMAIRSSDMISLITVNVDGDMFSSIVLEGKKTTMNYKKGDSVNLVFKETEVGIAKGLSGRVSFRNRFPGKIKKIEKSDVLAKIVVDYKGYTIESIISTNSAEEMDLQRNDRIEWLVKTNEVSLMAIPK